MGFFCLVKVNIHITATVYCQNIRFKKKSCSCQCFVVFVGMDFLHVCVPVCIAHCFGALHCIKCFGNLGFQPFSIMLLHEKKSNSGIWCREKHKSQVLFYSEW